MLPKWLKEVSKFLNNQDLKLLLEEVVVETKEETANSKEEAEVVEVVVEEILEVVTEVEVAEAEENLEVETEVEVVAAEVAKKDQMVNGHTDHKPESHTAEEMVKGIC